MGRLGRASISFFASSAITFHLFALGSSERLLVSVTVAMRSVRVDALLKLIYFVHEAKRQVFTSN